MKDADIVDFITAMAGTNAVGEWLYTIKKLQGQKNGPVLLYKENTRRGQKREKKR